MYKEKAADYFARHKESQECHITSDGRVFHSKGTADSFANTLNDNTVESFTRKQAEAKEIEVVDVEEVTGEGTDEGTGEGTGEGTDETESDLLPLDKKLLDFDTETASYQEIVAFVKELKLAADSNKQVDLVAAIIAAQETLKNKA